ncbi:MAG TPA: putative peptidoglycan glycosyltransferase FtsW [Bryobacteraceae bacterium]|nr:putative peptidoglycan glycosyltransferase FtsW [Bryobacteraceae bacterium]
MAQRIRTDWTLFITTVLMVSFGLVIVYSASSVVAELKFGSSAHFFIRQLGWAFISFLALMYFKRKDYRVLQNPGAAFACLGVVLAMLVAVYFLDARNHRWFRLGGLSLQPSEFAKPALAIFLAYFLTLRSRVINDRHTLLPASMAIVMLALTVVIADLGTAVVLVLTAAVVFYVAGLDRRYFIGALAAGVLLAGVAVLLKPYRLARIAGYLDPDYTLLDRIDPGGRIKNYLHQAAVGAHDPSYQARQSKIAVGAGGVLGVGLMQGKQKLLYLPEAHTDFIYAVVGEELGMWGCTALIAGFLIILWRGLRLFWVATDDFGRYLALGVTATIVIQAFINMSVVLDLAPTKGIPLPMISSGGSSLFSTLASLGMLLSVSEHAG